MIVWVKKQGDGDAECFLLRNNRLAVSLIGCRWHLDPFTVQVGDLKLIADAEGNSMYTMEEIRGFALAAGLGDGLTKESALVISGTNDDWVSALLRRYKSIAARSRSVNTVIRPVYDVEPGNNFDIVGRGGTFDVLLEGAGRMYSRFCSPSLDESTYRAGSFFFCMVAFPGAGKTTLGKRGWPYLVQSWENMTEQKKVELLKDECTPFKELMEESVKYNLLMYHEVANLGGCLVDGEAGLTVSQILGLRVLYMVIYDWRVSTMTYSGFLNDLDTHLPGLKQAASFALALEFLTQLLGLKKRVMATFFFDEVNAIHHTLSGNMVQEGQATWFQMLMSEYVREEYILARNKSLVFPVFSIATTRFSAGDLRFTESRKSTAVLVPFPPLSVRDAEQVVLRFLQDLAVRENQQVPTTLTNTVKLMVRLSGGMPRYISHGLVALGNGSQSSQALLQGCIRERNGLQTRDFVEHWKDLLRIRSHYAKYENARYPQVKRVLVKALAASVLGRQVRRCEEVVPGACQWWELEWSGVAALTSQRYLVTDDPGQVVGDVKLCPLLVEALLRMYADNGPVHWPPLSGTGWESKEISDALSVLLRLFLLKEGYDEAEFGMHDVVPQGAFVPDVLRDLRFRLKHVTRMFELVRHRQQDSSVELLMEHGTSGVLGPGNFAADWYIFLDGITFFGQSKISQLSDNATTIGLIMDSFEKDVRKFYKLPVVSQAGKQRFREAQQLQEAAVEPEPGKQRKRPRRRYPDDGEDDGEDDLHWPGKGKIPSWLEKLPVVYLFCSNKPLPPQTLAALELLQDDHAWARHIVVFHEREAVTRNDCLAVLNQIRSLPDL